MSEAVNPFASEPPPSVWGVGRLVVDDAVVTWPVSQSDVDDETTAAVDHLRSLGVANGDVVLVVALLSEAIHAVPMEKAAGVLGALYSSADATEMDAFRTEYLIAQLRPQTVVGVNRAVITGLRARGREPVEVFAAVPTVATTDEWARQALLDAGMTPRRWAKVGPTSALECAERSGLHLDGERWAVEVDRGRVRITNKVKRMTACERLATAFHGTVTDDPCPCGRPGPRLLPG